MMGRYGLFFLFALIFLLGGSLPSLLDFAELQARLTGVQTTALATAADSCSIEDQDTFAMTDGSYYTYTFTDRHGKVYKITDRSLCSSGIVADGERVTIWYQSDDPTHFVVASDWTFNVLFFVGFSIPMLLWIIFFSIALLRRLFVGKRRYL